MELTVAAVGTTAVEVASGSPPSAVVLSEPALSGNPRLLVLSGTSDEVELLAGRATIPWKKLMMLKRTARKRVVEGILSAWIVQGVDLRVGLGKMNDRFARTSRVSNSL